MRWLALLALLAGCAAAPQKRKLKPSEILWNACCDFCDNTGEMPLHVEVMATGAECQCLARVPDA
jgi:nitrous oxide reductase accessory protein NosL